MRRNILRDLIFILFFKPLTWIFLGLTVNHRERLPLQGPAILVANHNSHLDTIVLMSLYPISRLYQVRPVAAAEYFMTNPYLKWFCSCILQIIPIQRIFSRMRTQDPLEKVTQALQRNEIVIFYPEGTRGEPEQMGEFKKGIAHLARQYPQVPIVPIYLQGLGKVLPKGKLLMVPFNVKVVIGEPLMNQGDRQDFLGYLREQITGLSKEG